MLSNVSETHITLVDSLESLESKLQQCFICTSDILKRQHQNSIKKHLEELKQHIIEQKCNFILFTNPPEIN